MTRRAIRRGVIYARLGVGAAGLLLVVFSFFGEVQRPGLTATRVSGAAGSR